MSRLLLRRKSSIKSTIKPVPVVKEAIQESGVEFRWSTSVVQSGLLEKNPILNFHLIDLHNSQQKPFLFSSSSAARNSTVSRSSMSTEKLSPRLPNVNTVHQKNELLISTDENNNTQTGPLLLNYSQLHHAQHPSETKKKSRERFSIYPLLNDKKQSRISVVNSHVSFSSSIDKQKVTKDKYIRLQTSQLRQLHVSSKYMKEAKKLYFNAASKIFVPRLSIVQIC